MRGVLVVADQEVFQRLAVVGHLKYYWVTSTTWFIIRTSTDIAKARAVIGDHRHQAKLRHRRIRRAVVVECRGIQLQRLRAIAGHEHIVPWRSLAAVNVLGCKGPWGH